MKKSFNKKLVVNKKTVANLNSNQMNNVRAGEGSFFEECNTDIYLCQNTYKFCPTYTCPCVTINPDLCEQPRTYTCPPKTERCA